MKFTPYPGPIKFDDLDEMGRVHLDIPARDFVHIKRGCEWSATVTDQRSGRTFVVRDASCGQPHCRCAAVIVMEKT